MRIAIVGTGISGLVAGRRLHSTHDLTLFEADSRIGGHTNTIDVDDPSGPVAVDTGFIVFNPQHYPVLTALFDDLGVRSQPTDMSFGVRCERTGVEWAGRNFWTVFAQRSRLLRRGQWRLLRDIFRFNRTAKEEYRSYSVELSIGEFLETRGYSEEFATYYLRPMAAALWSSPLGDINEFSIRFVCEFFDNHGMLDTNGPKSWRVVSGGSKQYLAPLCEPFADRILVSDPVERVRRTADGVIVSSRSGENLFDHVILACHADQALRIVDDPQPKERAVLESFPYRSNHAVLHTDASVMPRNRRAWASWNYRIPDRDTTHVTTTYDQNALQGLTTAKRYFVTLDDTVTIDPSHIVTEIDYEHPVFSAGRVAAQAKRRDLIAVDGISYCGAYWGYGFHEDGARSGDEVANVIDTLAHRADMTPDRSDSS